MLISDGETSVRAIWHAKSITMALVFCCKSTNFQYVRFLKSVGDFPVEIVGGGRPTGTLCSAICYNHLVATATATSEFVDPTASIRGAHDEKNKRHEGYHRGETDQHFAR